MKRIPLGDVCKVGAGQAAPKKEEFSDQGRPFVRAGSLEALLSGSGEGSLEKVSLETAKAKRLKLYPKDTVLFAKSGMSATLGRVYRLKEEAHVVSHLATLEPTGHYDPKYLTHWMRANPPSNLINDPAYPSIRLGDVESVLVPDLTLEEQRRIATILDKADAIRRKRQKALTLADDFLRSTFLEMFGDPVLNTKGWAVLCIRACVESIEAGWSAKGGTQPAKEREQGVLKISAVTSGRYIPEENKVVDHVPAHKKLVVPGKGDLLFSRANTRELVAATCIVEEAVPNVFLPDKLWRIETKKQVATPEFLKGLLSNEDFRHQLCKTATGTSGSMLNISKEKFLSFAVPLPPIELQRAYSEVFWRHSALIKKLRKQFHKSEELFSSLSQLAFRGEL